MNASLLLVALAVSGTADFQAVLDQMRMVQNVPGISVVVSRGDQVIFSGASGTADIEAQRDMTADTVLYCGSLSKILTAVLVLQLVEEGKLALSDTVPGIAVSSAGGAPDISIEHLLTHASGLEREGNFGYWFSAAFPDEDALKQYLRATTLRTPPGSKLYYSNIGYATLGMVAAAAVNQSYNEALRARVLLPLGMTSSGGPGPAPGVAIGYTPAGRIIPSEERPFAGVGRAVGDRHVREYHDAKAMSPAFGVFTTANDLARLARFLLGYGGDDGLVRCHARANAHPAGRRLGPWLADRQA